MATDRLSELEQEIMQSDYDDEIAKANKILEYKNSPLQHQPQS